MLIEACHDASTIPAAPSVPVKNSTKLDLDIRMDDERLMFYFRGKKYTCDFRIQDLREGENIEVMLSGYCLRARCAGKTLEFVETNTVPKPVEQQARLPGADVFHPVSQVDWRNPLTTSSTDNPNHPSRNRLVARPSSPPLPVLKKNLTMQNTTGIDLNLSLDPTENSMHLHHQGRSYSCVLPKKADVSSAKVYVSNFEFKARVGNRTLSFTPDEPRHDSHPRKKLRVGLEASHDILQTPVEPEVIAEVKNLTAMPINPHVDSSTKKLTFEHLETKYECDLSEHWGEIAGHTLFVYVANFQFFARIAGKKLPIKKIVNNKSSDISWGSMLLAHTGLPCVHHNLVDHPLRCKNKTGMDWQEIQSSCLGGWIRLETADGRTYLCNNMDLTEEQKTGKEEAPEAIIYLANYNIYARVNGKKYSFKNATSATTGLKSNTKVGLPVTHALLNPEVPTRKLCVRNATGVDCIAEYCEEQDCVRCVYNGEMFTCPADRFAECREGEVTVYLANFKLYARSGSVKVELEKEKPVSGHALDSTVHLAPCAEAGLTACHSVLMDRPYTILNNTGAAFNSIHSSMRAGVVRVETIKGERFECTSLPKNGDVGTATMYYASGKLILRIGKDKYPLSRVASAKDQMEETPLGSLEKRAGIHANHALLTCALGKEGQQLIKTTLMQA